jgi:uncharacterized membrane protein YkvA (DUF1232 family)
MLTPLRSWSRKLKGEVLTVAIAMKDPRTPWYAKVLGAGIVAYALSPIDLIPDFIPILGMVDDAILLPLGIKLLVALVPEAVLADSRVKADSIEGKKRSVVGALLVLLTWVTILAALAVYFRRRT